MFNQIWGDFAFGLTLMSRWTIRLMRDSLTLLGLAVLCGATLVFMRPDVPMKLLELAPAAWVSEQLASISDITERISAAQDDDLGVEEENARHSPLAKQLTREQQNTARWIARKYRLALDATEELVAAAFVVGKEKGVDPYLILAVTSIESGFNPFAESPVGAQGLMQVMSRVHQDKLAEFGGVRAALDPFANMRVGAQILRDNLHRGGTVEAALKFYVGATGPDDGGYGAKVLAERARLLAVASGKAVPTIGMAPVPMARPATPAAPAAGTSGQRADPPADAAPATTPAAPVGERKGDGMESASVIIRPAPFSTLASLD